MSDNNPWGNERFEFPWNKKKKTSSAKHTGKIINGSASESTVEEPKTGGNKPPKSYFNIAINFPIWITVLIIVGIWLVSGFYIVGPDQQAVVKRFGKISIVTSPGPHYHLPYPIETVDKAEVTKIHRIEIGYAPGSGNSTINVKKESQMLTGDENIVSVKLIVQYQIKDITEYLYNVEGVPATIKNAAQSAIREVAGKEKIDELLTTGKNRVQQETLDILQKMMDNYKAGVRIVAVQLLEVNPPQEVDFAFKDVASAREDKNRFINEAETYSNQVIPQARGAAETMIQEAEAYSAQKIEQAKGDAARFEQVLKAYKQAPNVTKKRMYIETIEKALKDANVKVFDSTIKNINHFIGLDKPTNTKKD